MATQAQPISRLGPQGGPWPESDPFFYPLNSPSMAANQLNAQAQLQLNPDADFWWDWIICGGNNINFSVYLIDASRGIPLLGSQIAPLQGNNLAGVGNSLIFPILAFLPLWLPKPYKLKRNTIISALFNNLSGAVGNVQVVLGGRLVQ